MVVSKNFNLVLGLITYFLSLFKFNAHKQDSTESSKTNDAPTAKPLTIVQPTPPVSEVIIKALYKTVNKETYDACVITVSDALQFALKNQNVFYELHCWKALCRIHKAFAMLLDVDDLQKHTAFILSIEAGKAALELQTNVIFSKSPSVPTILACSYVFAGFFVRKIDTQKGEGYLDEAYFLLNEVTDNHPTFWKGSLAFLSLLDGKRSLINPQTKNKAKRLARIALDTLLAHQDANTPEIIAEIKRTKVLSNKIRKW